MRRSGFMCWVERNEWGERRDDMGVYLCERHGDEDCNAYQRSFYTSSKNKYLQRT